MSSLTAIPSNVGIHGAPNSNSSCYRISREINEAYLDCFIILDEMKNKGFEQKKDLLQLINSVYEKSNKYIEKAIDNRKTYEFTRKEFFPTSLYATEFELNQFLSLYEPEIIAKQKLVESKKVVDDTLADLTASDAILTQEELHSLLIRVARAARDIPHVQPHPRLVLAELEFQIESKSFGARRIPKHEELVKLIEIKTDTCPRLKSSIDRWQTFLSLEAAQQTDKSDPTIGELLIGARGRLNDFLITLDFASRGEMSPVFTPIAEAIPATSDVEQEIEISNLPTSPVTTLEASKEMAKETISDIPQMIESERVVSDLSMSPSPRAKVMLTYNVGWGQALGVCCEPLWENQPIALSNLGNDWSGEVPVGKNWKFVILKGNKVVKWENSGDRRINKDAVLSDLNYTEKVKFF